ncbi:hypothetical protein [Paenibacillus sp. HB172176]|uniref:hypothetical protein n=1 Tax=Paenibacillus sp. HB172176 TaxID=2493690 RepID=UPI001438A24C|nr:hypothetical protein [Paenibacillus sp. HB172176]
MDKLTLDHIMHEASKFDEMEKVVLDGIGFTEIYKYFSPQKIDNMLDDLSQFLAEYAKNSGESVTEAMFFDYLHIYIVMHFSTLLENLPTTYEARADIINRILNSEIIEKLGESFDKSELAKVTERLMQKLDLFQKMVNENFE